MITYFLRYTNERVQAWWELLDSPNWLPYKILRINNRKLSHTKAYDGSNTTRLFCCLVELTRWKWREIRMTRKATEFRYTSRSTNLWRRGRFLSDGQTPRKEAEIQRLDDSSTSILSLEQTYKMEKIKLGNQQQNERSINGQRKATVFVRRTTLQQSYSLG